MSASSPCGVYTDVSDILYFCRRDLDNQEFAYRFKEYHPDDTQRNYPYFTNRTITASSGPCFAYGQTKRHYFNPDEGKMAMWYYEFSNGTNNGNVTIPVQYEAASSTTYLYRGIVPPQNATIYDCGPRYMWMYAHMSPVSPLPSDGPDPNSIFYLCPITVSAVANAMQPAHQVPNGIARLAAASIALQGRVQDPPYLWEQYQFYPVGSPWEIHSQPPSVVGANMAEFAIASISSMDALNTGVVIPGEQPALGSRLVFTWAQALGLLLSIVAAHLVLLVLIFEAELFRRRVIRGSGAEDKVRLLGKTGREGWRTAVTGRNEGRTGEGGALLGGREAEHVGEGVVEESGTGAVAVATIAGEGGGEHGGK
ncbi:hypothetical protein MMC10_006797 [Thelotrema lepadinum]|nr:hypothetical protein [Thelotrema lepadinum]